MALLEAYKPIKGESVSSPKSIDFSAADGKTALHHACMYGYGEIAVLLLDDKANMNAVDKENKTVYLLLFISNNFFSHCIMQLFTDMLTL
jgi:hypothetical protein